ncbi:MAG: OmpA family protein, partial [Salinimicrobium sediminis]|nr:OmpA family protein [Salinimicrobium sediminis]
GDLKFSIEGHTDSDGDDTHNLQLSEQRALAVKDALIAMGIDSSRMQHKGLGESVPVAENSSPEGKANNRRVEFVKI